MLVVNAEGIDQRYPDNRQFRRYNPRTAPSIDTVNRIVPLPLQFLVENAIKHNRLSLAEPWSSASSCRRRKSWSCSISCGQSSARPIVSTERSAESRQWLEGMSDE